MFAPVKLDRKTSDTIQMQKLLTALEMRKSSKKKKPEVSWVYLAYNTKHINIPTVHNIIDCLEYTQFKMFLIIINNVSTICCIEPPDNSYIFLQNTFDT